MNPTSYHLPKRLSTILKPCHPERSLAESEANRQTESKDPYDPDTSRSTEANFRVVVRFFDEHEAELRPVPSHEEAAWESPTRQCRMGTVDGASPEATAPLHESSRITQ